MGFNNRKYCRGNRMIVVILFLLCCQTMFCQPYDRVSFFSNENVVKTQYNLLERRLQVEVVLLTPEQKKLAETFSYYKQIEDSLDLYDQAFDFLRVIQGGLQLYFTARRTIEDVTASMEGIYRLTNEYIDKCAMIGSFREEDRIFYNEAVNLYTVLSTDFSHLANQITIIVPFIGGQYGFACTVYTLSQILSDLIETLALIREHVTGCYHRLYRYMKMRLGFWTNASLRGLYAKSSVEDAFRRWSAAYHKDVAIPKSVKH